MRVLREFILFLFSLLLLDSISEAQLKLPSFFSDHMVFQRGQKINVWGMAEPGSTMTVSLNRKFAKARANAEGRWQLSLPAMKEGGPYEMEVKAGEEMIVLKDIYIGDVWLASGQSNMQWSVSATLNAEKEIKEANYPLIRLLQVPVEISHHIRWDVNCKWQVCSPETVRDFSAVAYFFARELYKNLKIPIGIINSSQGGTPAEVWMSWKALASNTKLKRLKPPARYIQLEPWVKYDIELEKWQSEVEKAKKEGKPESPPPKAPNWEFMHPAGLFNSMIASFTRFPIKGVIWYQGESNIFRAEEYTILFSALIEDWRKIWGIGDFPFLFVQIAPVEPPKTGEPSENPDRKSVV